MIFLPKNEVSNQNGAKSVTASNAYQVVYFLEIRYSLGDYWWQIWYLPKCPIVGFHSLVDACRKAKEWKVQFGGNFKPVIIGQNDGDFESIDCDDLFGISAIGGSDAGELAFPDFLFEWSEDL